MNKRVHDKNKGLQAGGIMYSYKNNQCTRRDNILTYLLTPWSRVLIEKLTSKLVKKFPTFIEPKSPSLYPQVPATCPYPEPTPSSPHDPSNFLKIHLNIIPHLCLGLPSSLFPSGFPTNTLCTPLSSPIRATCPAHLIRLDFTTRTIFGKEYRSFSSSLCSFLNSPVTSTLLGPNTLLNTLFTNVLISLQSHNIFCFLWPCYPSRVMAFSFLRFLDHI